METIIQEVIFMKNSSKKQRSSTDWDIDIQSCSATDCTGLIPALPETDAELEHYQELYHYLPDSTRSLESILPDRQCLNTDHLQASGS